MPTRLGLGSGGCRPRGSWWLGLSLLALLLGWLLTAGRRLPALVAGALVVAGLAVGRGKTFDDDHRRLPLRDAARIVDAAARPGDAVVQVSSRGALVGE
jgi:hypothetical protein